MNPDRSFGQRFSTAIAYVIIAATGFAVFSLIVWGIVAIWVRIGGALSLPPQRKSLTWPAGSSSKTATLCAHS